jgi:hypothetical protein
MELLAVEVGTVGEDLEGKEGNEGRGGSPLLVREGGAGKREEEAAGTLAGMSKARVSCGRI